MQKREVAGRWDQPGLGITSLCTRRLLWLTIACLSRRFLSLRSPITSSIASSWLCTIPTLRSWGHPISSLSRALRWVARIRAGLLARMISLLSCG
uniref:Uncharacterized protein n=1 Tax=Solanum lycopersicum TaxID=4081 RepID=K4DH68_SOLLC